MFTKVGKNFEIAFDARKKHGSIEMLGYGIRADVSKILVRPAGLSFWIETDAPTPRKEAFFALLAEKKPKTVYLAVGVAGSLIYEGLEFETMEDRELQNDYYVIMATLPSNNIRVVIAPALVDDKDWIFDDNEV